MLTNKQKTKLEALIEAYGKAQYEAGASVRQGRLVEEVLNEYRKTSKELYDFIRSI